RIANFYRQCAGTGTHKLHGDAPGGLVDIGRRNSPLDHATTVGWPGGNIGGGVGDGSQSIRVVLARNGGRAFVEQGGKFQAVGRYGGLTDVLIEDGRGSR